MNQFDERLFLLKLQPINQRMHGEAGKCWGRARGEVQRLGNHARLLPAFVECQLEVLRKYLEEVYRLRHEVWLLDGNAVTPEFIRNLAVPHVFTVIAARKGAIQHELNVRAMRTGDHQRGGHILVHQMNQLQGELANRYEIEAIELSKKELQARKVTQALPPPHEVSGLAISHAHAKSAQIPPNPPVYFPTDLWPKTVVILAEAVKKFPDRGKQMPDLCRQYISDMTPIFYEAVENGMLKPGAVLSEGLGGMQDLLRSLLVYNDDGPHSGFGGLSNEAYRIYQEARNSEEWLKLAKSITDAKPEASSSVGMRTKRSSGAQGSANSAQDVKRKPERGNPEVAKRAVIVRSNPSASADEMCAIFDRENVPLPRKWLDAGFSTWIKANKNSSYRSRIQTLVSKNRRRKN